jgi:hypothetical protein
MLEGLVAKAADSEEAEKALKREKEALVKECENVDEQSNSVCAEIAVQLTQPPEDAIFMTFMKLLVDPAWFLDCSRSHAKVHAFTEVCASIFMSIFRVEFYPKWLLVLLTFLLLAALITAAVTGCSR